MLLINNNFACYTGLSLTEPNGNFIIMELKILTKNYSSQHLRSKSRLLSQISIKTSSKRYKILEMKML